MEQLERWVSKLIKGKLINKNNCKFRKLFTYVFHLKKFSISFFNCLLNQLLILRYQIDCPFESRFIKSKNYFKCFIYLVVNRFVVK